MENTKPVLAITEAEEAVLGSVLINPDTLERLDFLMASDFFLLRNRWIWEAFRALYQRGDAIDALTVCKFLEHEGKLDTAGGSAYITTLINNTPTYVHAETYAQMVYRVAVRRKLLSAAEQIASVAGQANIELDELVDQAEALIFDVTETRRDNRHRNMRELISELFDYVDERSKNPDQFTGIPTGLKELDEMTDGMTGLWIIGARPGMGKTALALLIALNVAKLFHQRVAFFSMEMTELELLKRLVSLDTGIDHWKIKSGRLTDSEWNLFTESMARLAELPLDLMYLPRLTANGVSAECRRLYREHGLDLVMVDYLNLMSSGRAENRNLEVDELTRELKLLSGELKTPVVAMAQLNRNLEARADKRPTLSDLRDSGAIEQHADLVLFLYRAIIYEESADPTDAELIVGKNRHGATGLVGAKFHGATMRYSMKQTIPLGKL